MQRVWCVLGVAAACMWGGCAGDRGGSGPNAGLEKMTGRTQATPKPALRLPPRRPTSTPGDAERSELAELIRQQAIDTQKILDGEPAGGSPRPGVEPAPLAADSGPAGAPIASRSPTVPPASAPSVPGGATRSDPAPARPAFTALAAAPALTIDQQVEEAAGRLAELLRDQAGTGGSLRPRAAIAAIEGLKLRPPVPQPPTDSLTPSQRRALEGFREAVGAIAAEAERPESDGEEPARLAEQFGSLADRLSAGRGFAVSDLRLCTNVRGFGQYTTFAEGAVRFVAGRAQRALVYVEVDRFAHRAIEAADADLAGARDRGERWVVDLTQEINLYSEQGNLLVQRRPPERVVETSRTRRRDFYLVTELTLPGTLAVGVYHLKVTVRDRAGGAVAERSLPIEIVADAAMAGVSK